MCNLQNNLIEKTKDMFLELVKKGFELLKAALVKFKVQAEEIEYITAEADNIFSLYMENGWYDKIDRICEDDLFDNIVDYSLNSAEYDIDKYITSLLDERKDFLYEDRQAVLSFFHEIRKIIVAAQIRYGIKDPENKVLSKQIQAVQASLDATVKIDEHIARNDCLIGIIACEIDDPRTRELSELPENCLLNLNPYINSFDDVQVIISNIENFKNNLNNVTTYKVKLACNYSLAYLTGAVFTQKTSNLVFINRDNEWSIGEADKIKLNCKTFQKNNSGRINVAITVGTNSYIDDDVLAFIGEDTGLFCIHYGSHIQTSGQFNAIGNEITKRLKKIAKNSSGPINLFYRGPVEIMFLLGQKSNDFGRCTIYEYGFKERDIQKRTYKKGITF